MLSTTLDRLFKTAPLIKDASASGNLTVLRSLLGPAWRGFIQQKGRGEGTTSMPLGYEARFDWHYLRDRPQLARLYEAAKTSQWNATTALDWTQAVALDEKELLLPESFFPVFGHPCTRGMTEKEKAIQRQSFMSWILSQFLHGEQGALFAACQVTEAVPWLDGKFYGSTQVMDEGRHVEVFHRYLTQKLEKKYDINDNLYVVIDALMSDSRWDMKFLGMQIMVEGLALGAFGMIQQKTREPLLKQMLTYVITDEARHVHFGVLALQEHIKQLSERERREREDWTFEVCLFLRNRFLGHELYDEFYGHAMTRKAWDALITASEMMGTFRTVMFKRVIPNLKRIGLLSERIRPKYAELGLLGYESGRAAPDLTATDLLEDRS
ncbi:MAG: ferritin-like domain-containing protein [Archangiaceae bacterium]|nr:ferritin-like domain-containing protein [Archangiaceae bacterium]